MSGKKVRAAVAGANGYAGMTLVHLLSRHPGVELVQLTSRSFAGRPYQDVFPLLEIEGSFAEEVDAEEVEVVFACLPHNVCAGKAAGWLEKGARVIDMSADFRLKDKDQYPRWYKQDHPSPELLKKAVFGLPELHAEEIEQADLIAVPGCYSTCAILALKPAAEAGLIQEDGVIVDAKSGVSGAGRSPSLGVHFSELDESLGAYALNGHRHLPEMTQELGLQKLTFVPHLVPMVRGILATCYLDATASLEDLREAYQEFYAGQPFTRLLERTPTTKLASHTNLCLVNLAQQDGKTIVTAALDNLVKGASGQGVECFNLAFGFERSAGLEIAPQWP